MNKKRPRRLYDSRTEQILVQGDDRLPHLQQRLASKRNRKRVLPERTEGQAVVTLDQAGDCQPVEQ